MLMKPPNTRHVYPESRPSDTSIPTGGLGNAKRLTSPCEGEGSRVAMIAAAWHSFAAELMVELAGRVRALERRVAGG